MPLNVRRFCTSVLLVLVSFVAIINAQVPAASPMPTTPQPSAPQVVTGPPKSPTSAEIMRERISKSKAFIAVRNYNAAIYELENIRRETNDVSVQSVTNVLLMNSYLEQGDYKRAQAFLTESFTAQKANKPNSSEFYSTVAGQVVKGARNQIDRYRALGLSVSDRNLPLEAVNDIERMRETLELVITQTKEIGKDKAKSANAMALLEEATVSRSAMGRDDYDARRWKDEAADSREQMAVSRSVIINAVDGTTVAEAVPANKTTAAVVASPTPMPTVAASTPAFKPVPTEPANKPSEKLLATNDNPIVQTPKKPETETQRIRVINTPDSTKNNGPMEVGSLKPYATKQPQPMYPIAAKNMRMAGVVKVEVTVDENGDVSAINSTAGPQMLQGAAKDAIRKWKFRPFMQDGQPVKATGFINFNFSL